MNFCSLSFDFLLYQNLQENYNIAIANYSELTSYKVRLHILAYICYEHIETKTCWINFHICVNFTLLSSNFHVVFYHYFWFYCSWFAQSFTLNITRILHLVYTVTADGWECRVVCSRTNTRGTDSTLLQRLIVRGLRIICFLINVQTLHRLYLCIPFVISHNFKEMNLIYTPQGFGQRTRFSLKLWPLSSLMSL